MLQHKIKDKTETTKKQQKKFPKKGNYAIKAILKITMKTVHPLS